MVAVQAIGEALRQQAPEYAHLKLSPMSARSGTDNEIYKLGDHTCVRIPKSREAAFQLQKETDWLKRFQTLPLIVPKPLFLGGPTDQIEFNWAIYDWIEGQDLRQSFSSEGYETADRLGAFLKALWQIDASHGPMAGAQNHYRGVPLKARQELTRHAIEMLSDEFPKQRLIRIWEKALEGEPFTGPLRWLHGDLHAANLIQREGQLIGVIDWGLMGIGDPAVDLMPAWSLLSSETRPRFKRAIGVDAPIWQRGKGWALSVSVIAYSYYREQPSFWLNDISLKTLTEVLSEADAP